LRKKVIVSRSCLDSDLIQRAAVQGGVAGPTVCCNSLPDLLRDLAVETERLGGTFKRIFLPEIRNVSALAGSPFRANIQINIYFLLTEKKRTTSWAQLGNILTWMGLTLQQHAVRLGKRWRHT